MKKKYYIKDYVKLKHHRIFYRDELVFEGTGETKLDAFLKSGYKALEIDYPKFHKMDNLCKLGILATQVLLNRQGFSPDTAMVFSNSASSLDTDKKYAESMAEIPSPSLFVYTLPNIVLGELSIKYKFQGENAFFIAEKFDATLFYDYGQSLLEAGIDELLCGWIDLQNEEYDVFLCLVSTEGEIPFSEENLSRLYHV